MYELNWRAMGSKMRILLDADTPRAAETLERVPQWFEAWEQILSRFRPDSELSRLNQRSGEWVSLSRTLWQVVEMAFRAAGETDGMLTPLVLPALESAGYTTSFDSGVFSSQENSASLLDWRAVEKRKSDRAVWLPPGTRLDLGGFGKGWATHVAARRLSSLGCVMVDAGGDIALAAPPGWEVPWKIDVADPLHSGSPIAQFQLERGGVATSGRDFRRWWVGGVERHHLIDPRTGQPVETDVLTATVIAPDVRQAEKAAKVILILGSRAGLAWIESQPKLAALVITQEALVRYTTRLNRYLWSSQ